MKVLLINPKATQFNRRRKAPSVPLGLLAIASYIKKEGHTVQIVDLTVKPENIEKHLKRFSPDVVGVSYSSTLVGNSAVKVSKAAKKYGKPVVWGGHMASVLTELCFREGCVDYIVMGEGEITFNELLDTLENGGSFYDISGLAFLDKDGVHINEHREFADLAEFPALDWSLLNPVEYSQVYFHCSRMVYLYFSKGCPAKCTFCYSPKYHRCTHRRRPPEQLVDEIEYLVNRCGIDGINFADELWNPGTEDMQTFFRLIKERNLRFVWGCQTRLGVFGKEELRQMHDAGCRWILFGIESGSKERLKEVKKGINLDKAKETIDHCREIGITTQSSFIIGYPGETREELKETVRFAMSLNANMCPLNVCFLQPGSEMFDAATAAGQYIPPKNLKEWDKLQCDEYSGKTLSRVPMKELLVLHFYAQWLGFSRKESVGSDSYGVAKQLAVQAVKNMFKLSPDNFFLGFFTSAKQFFTVVWYAKAYPKILKKYGLYKHKSGK